MTPNRPLTPLERRILELLDGQPPMSGPATVDYVYERLPDFPGSWWDLAKSPVAHLLACGYITLRPEREETITWLAALSGDA